MTRDTLRLRYTMTGIHSDSDSRWLCTVCHRHWWLLSCRKIVDTYLARLVIHFSIFIGVPELSKESVYGKFPFLEMLPRAGRQKKKNSTFSCDKNHIERIQVSFVQFVSLDCLCAGVWQTLILMVNSVDLSLVWPCIWWDTYAKVNSITPPVMLGDILSCWMISHSVLLACLILVHRRGWLPMKHTKDDLDFFFLFSQILPLFALCRPMVMPRWASAISPPICHPLSLFSDTILYAPVSFPTLWHKREAVLGVFYPHELSLVKATNPGSELVSYLQPHSSYRMFKSCFHTIMLTQSGLLLPLCMCVSAYLPVCTLFSQAIFCPQ